MDVRALVILLLTKARVNVPNYGQHFKGKPAPVGASQAVGRLLERMFSLKVWLGPEVMDSNCLGRPEA